jgi:O-acetyl-ADP-ribose deacetylase (regulator of RNase III)
MLTVVKNQNILDFPGDVIVNTVNCQGIMGKGLAKQVRERYPNGVLNYLKNASTMMKPGDVIVDTVCDIFIFHLATKNTWRANSKIEWIRAGLQNLIAKGNEYNIKSIALPLIGCGCGKLNPLDVYREIQDCGIANYFEVHLYIKSEIN